MKLFDQIVGALNNPALQANINQINDLINTAQQLGVNFGGSPETTQAVMSVVGDYVRSALKEKCNQEGKESVQSFVNQYSGIQANPAVVQLLFSPQTQNRLIEAVEQRTGVNAQTIRSLLPLLVPVVLNFLQTGTNSQDPQKGENPVLTSFLDSTGDGEADIAGVLRLASSFFKR
ncbi:MAG: DUF937 domain-containing protein [Limnospira sp. PMC 1291.21]|uniref:DUF937 domain-containing protein n=3 Tax=Limnospira TaxID=2596745 RepID=A0A9P1KJ75_9CYAN|nr:MULTISPECIES: DUF937 domain-containing protein [Limnospira]EKD07943.1 hypothetical protein SPLC1_S310040 [Arthrospira platensis C1]MBD2671487.1 DUF937 domain-containing protein [Arthrospira platensis FACHB-439]MBD2712488.1 DUF937 domain-containing protein [Arthrospira platensis FACHB-835]MDC0840182.1 DUF937 domain-containing protein [Limnoraphis robusta]MDY7051297.1 DUF937 domain-containing protein [Limnospira fusiformis LS22]QJB25386.1 DUF937 domain-containing protein [Limnospira fusiform